MSLNKYCSSDLAMRMSNSVHWRTWTSLWSRILRKICRNSIFIYFCSSISRKDPVHGSVQVFRKWEFSKRKINKILWTIYLYIWISTISSGKKGAGLYVELKMECVSFFSFTTIWILIYLIDPMMLKYCCDCWTLVNLDKIIGSYWREELPLSWLVLNLINFKDSLLELFRKVPFPKIIDPWKLLFWKFLNSKEAHNSFDKFC